MQGKGIVKGPLIGGCIDAMEMIKGTSLWPSYEKFEDAILFFETREDTLEPSYIEYWRRYYRWCKS